MFISIRGTLTTTQGARNGYIITMCVNYSDFMNWTKAFRLEALIVLKASLEASALHRAIEWLLLRNVLVHHEDTLRHRLPHQYVQCSKGVQYAI